MGGAGAQLKFVTALVKARAPLIKDGHVQLFLNAGDHIHMKNAFETTLKEVELEYTHEPTMKCVRDFWSKTKTEEPTHQVTLFAFDGYFMAVATTNILCEVSDMLAAKPSELAFYPIPKLMI